MIYALVKDGKVKNKIEADAIFAASISSSWDHVVLVLDEVNAPDLEDDYDYEGNVFIPKPLPPPLPPTVDPAAAIKAKLLATNLALVTTLPEMKAVLTDLIEYVKVKR